MRHEKKLSNGASKEGNFKGFALSEMKDAERTIAGIDPNGLIGPSVRDILEQLGGLGLDGSKAAGARGEAIAKVRRLSRFVGLHGARLSRSLRILDLATELGKASPYEAQTFEEADEVAAALIIGVAVILNRNGDDWAAVTATPRTGPVPTMEEEPELESIAAS